MDLYKIYLFRMVHFDNLEYILQTGMCASTHPLADPAYRNIGNRTLIRDREEYQVPIPPRGTLGEYIPFYFGGHSPMLLNIKSGRQGVECIPQRDIVYIVSSVGLIDSLGVSWCFTNGHAKSTVSRFFNGKEDFGNIDFAVTSARYWNNTDEDPDRQRRKQAEFLAKDFIPVKGIIGLIVADAGRQHDCEELIAKNNLSIKMYVDVTHKYFYP